MKNIVIFGAASAIAQETARLFAKEGAQMVLIDKDEQRLKAVADDMRVRGAQLAAEIAVDLTLLEVHERLIDRIWQTLHDEIDIVLIAYGTLGDQRYCEQNFNAAYKEFLTNFISVASLLTHLVNRFEKANETSEAVSADRQANQANEANKALPAGRQVKIIAVISSVAGDRGRQSNYIYGTAKGALTVFLSGIRNRLAKKKIYVITIKPGFVDTPMTKDFKKGMLWVKPHTVAKGIYKAIEKKKNIVYVPFFWRYIMWIIKAIPEPIFKKMKL